MARLDFLLVITLIEIAFQFASATNFTKVSDETRKRSKRELSSKYLAFPEGSNVQLVYCLTISTYAKPSGIFTIGVTSGLAWELPHRNTVSRMDLAEVYHRRSRRELYRKVELMLRTLPDGFNDADAMTKYDRAYLWKENCDEVQDKCPDVF